MNRYKLHWLFIGGLLAGSLSGCRILHQPAPTPVMMTPPSFTGNADSAGIGEQPFRSLFTDPNLVALIDTALVRNLDVKIALQRIEGARATYSISQGALLPQVDAVAAAGVDRFGRYTLNGVGNFDTNLSDNVRGNLRIPDPTPDLFAGFRASWELDIWGKLRNRRRAAYNRVLASVEGRNLVVTALIADIARLYYSLLADDAELEIIRDNIELQQRAVDLVTIQKQAGRVTELAVQQFNAQLLNTRALEGQVRQQIVETENQLNGLLGRFPTPIPRGSSIRDQQLPGSVRAGVPAQLVRRRPDIRQAERELEAANIDVAVARAEFLPGLTLTPYLGLNAFRPGVLLNPASVATGVLGSLVAPVFNRRLLRGNLASSQAQSREAYYAYQRAILTGVGEVVSRLQGLENYRDVADLQTQEVAVLRQAATTANDLFAASYATYLEVITAQRSVLDAELGLINTKQAQFTALIDLYRALGGGWQ
ncbi:efflux transporter outer membrane subunit [Spirosoma sordidisoli]|uniref:Efflux transporter outer membrane subunit n=1 Tax=Spirosoma sordidisoli TaxID=2502893 RepID=A0A4Q2UFS9_9BACT|nr:efflux transporter outer membrane subunit [Spirosoma sordidisoli]RYC68127.1 efflux transporter outer membrane subunit [Spirosoma sordidisoli]